jgi:sugar transferase (PEP-CTERM/EpsH1 system associated)
MKLLVVLSRFPYPLEKGDKLRAYHQIRCLAEQHEIYLAAMYDEPVSDDALNQLKPFCKEIFLLENNNLKRCWNMGRAFFRGLPIQCGLFYNRKNAQKLDEIIQRVHPDHIYCQLFRMAEYVKDYSIPKTLDYQDVFSKGMARRAEKSTGLVKWFFNMEHRRVARYETEIFDRFDHKTIITAVDRDLIPHPRREEIVVVPNGVEFDKFAYQGEKKEYDLIFSGNMGYAPNVDAAEYLVREILPPLRMKFPNLRVVLCGATPAPRVQALRSEHVIVTGWVDSMAEWYAKSRIFIAPMRMGTGLQNKLLEAMSMHLPCITSPLAARPLVEAEQHQSVISCSETKDYVVAVTQLLTEENAYNQLADSGYNYVRQFYDWKNAVRILDNLMEA